MATEVKDYAGKVTVADGAWGTELDKLGCPPGYCREEWNVSRPELVEQVAASYVEAGSQIVLTNTFQANRVALEKSEHADRVAEFNRAGAEISKRAAGDEAKVFGSMGPSGKMLLTEEIDEPTLLDVFGQQAEALAAGGVDAIVVETMSELAEGVAAIKAAKKTGLLVVGCMTFDSGKDKTHTMMGVSPEQAVEGYTEAGADIVGCNCGAGVETYVKVTEMMRAVTDKPIWVKANAGLPEIDGSKVVYTMTADEFARQVRRLIDAGANIVGGCCGSSPDFIRAIRATLT